MAVYANVARAHSAIMPYVLYTPMFVSDIKRNKLRTANVATYNQSLNKPSFAQVSYHYTLYGPC